MSSHQGFDNRPTEMVSGTVKWFNAEKGFGFVQPADGSADVFLHISALKRSNLEDAPQGSRIECEVVQAPKGRQVQRIIELDVSTAVAAPPRRPRPPMGAPREGGFERDYSRGPRPPREGGGFLGDRGGYRGGPGGGPSAGPGGPPGGGDGMRPRRRFGDDNRRFSRDNDDN